MISRCEVVLRNNHAMVAQCDGKDIQFPSDNGIDEFIYVKTENGKHSIVGKDEYLKSVTITKNEAVKDKQIFGEIKTNKNG